jgi:5,10-methylenetetrahydromethanopterin reductase
MTDIPHIGMRLHGGIDPRRCVELAAVADANGLTSVWFAENPFHRGALPAAAACAAATRHVRIGIGVLNPYNRHPTLMAMEIGALDDLAQGRAALGIGSGIASAIERMGVSHERPLGAVRDAIVIVRGLLRGEEVDYCGRVFSARKVRLDFTPRRANFPLFMAARGDQALRLCGQIADGLMISNACPPAFTAHAVATVRAAARAAGRDGPFEVMQYVPCAVRPDRDEARALIKDTIGEMLPGFWVLGDKFPAARAAVLSDGRIAAAEFAACVARLQAGEPPRAVLDDRFIAAFALAGTAEDCLAQAAVYAASGVTELVLTFAGPHPEDAVQQLGHALRARAAHPSPAATTV